MSKSSRGQVGTHLPRVSKREGRRETERERKRAREGQKEGEGERQSEGGRPRETASEREIRREGERETERESKRTRERDTDGETQREREPSKSFARRPAVPTMHLAPTCKSFCKSQFPRKSVNSFFILARS